jgi:hypothetical protein
MEDLPRTFHGRAKSLENRAERASTDLNENVLKSMRYADRTFLDMVGVTGSIPVAPTILPSSNRTSLTGRKLSPFCGLSEGQVRNFRSLSRSSPVAGRCPASGLCTRKFHSWQVWIVRGGRSDSNADSRFRDGYCGLSPSTSNCWRHSGASRSRSTPIPRGKRPSTAALTRSGARKASEIVMLT